MQFKMMMNFMNVNGIIEVKCGTQCFIATNICQIELLI